ncbi:MAG TPA: endonuclease/exonuclease/phosphatase family protein, partial [Burkholderiaceae bacterium]|nr:endonuclease/exonuclease/phosphatase family protein [Burkholderiaceae bacterium]
PSDEGPFQPKVHTPHAVLCGDFNAGPADDAIAAVVSSDGPQAAHAFRDAWPLVHGNAAHAPTFRLFDHTYGDNPESYDFVFVSAELATRVRRIEVDLRTRASDHQPVVVELGA